MPRCDHPGLLRHASLLRNSGLLGAVSLCAVLLAACSGSTEGTTAPPTAEAASPAPASEASPDTPAMASSMSAESSYLTTNCGQMAPPLPSGAPPAGGQTLGEVTVTSDEQGVPQITVGPQAGPVADLQTLDLASGDGAEVREGDVITFNYCGVGMTTRQGFDSSWARNEPLTYGLDELIPGWIAGIPGMKVGGERLLVIPGDLGYGPEPNPASGILPDETLIFVVEVLDVVEAS